MRKTIRLRLRKRIEQIKRFHHKGGHGIHSPFAFQLITEVVEEPNGYYRLSDFKRLLCLIAQNHPTLRSELHPSRYYERLFRLYHHFPLPTVIQIGNNRGLLLLLFQLAGRPTAHHIIVSTTEQQSQLNRSLTQFAEQLGLSTSPRITTLPSIKEIDPSQPHLLLILHNASTDQRSLDTLSPLLQSIHPNAIWVIDAIYEDPNMKQLWAQLIAHPRTVASFDLYDMGILVFNPSIHTQNYKLYF